MSKQALVYCIHPDDYEIFDERISKPLCLGKRENGIDVGSMVMQEIDEVFFKNNPLTYFPPNNVGLLLSLYKKSLKHAKEIYDSKINPLTNDHSYIKAQIDKKEFLRQKSKIVADYIEAIQTSIVFSYTTLEAFANISIEQDYKYEVFVKNRGIHEIYNKEAIERWIGLKDKLLKILPDTYGTKKIELTKFWPLFIKLENYRHDIIHQKSIDATDFYKKYFNKDIFSICNCTESILEFFYKAHAEKEKTNRMWPWLISKEKEFPFMEYNPNNLQIIGNLFEGKIKRS